MNERDYLSRGRCEKSNKWGSMDVCVLQDSQVEMLCLGQAPLLVVVIYSPVQFALDILTFP